MNRYQQLRGNNQETYYNIGRMFHQMNILHLAIYFYEKCLKVNSIYARFLLAYNCAECCGSDFYPLKCIGHVFWNRK